MAEDEISAEQAPVVPDPPVASEPAQPTEGEIQAALFFDSKEEDPYLGPGSIRMLTIDDLRRIESQPAESSERSTQSEQDESSEP
jgi:hypothetical protein